MGKNLAKTNETEIAVTLCKYLFKALIDAYDRGYTEGLGVVNNRKIPTSLPATRKKRRVKSPTNRPGA